jgi:hypothetical protein
LACDLLLATFSKEIARKTRVHTRGLSPGNSLVKHARKLGDSPRVYGQRWFRWHSSTAPTRREETLAVLFSIPRELVGVNFDRAFEATINDFAWKQRYSRFGRGRRSVCVMDHRRGFWYKQLVQEMLSNNTATIAPGASLDKAPVIYPREVRLLALNSGTVPKYLRTMRQRRRLTVFRLFVPLATVAAGSDRLGTIDLPI